jgi:uncharacterized protein involved in exopolysaccharide biosynthesis
MSDEQNRNDSPTGDEVSLLQLVSVLVRRWRLVLGLPVAAAALTAVVVLLWPPMYTATTSFVPESGSQPNVPPGLAGIAGQFGLSLGSDGTQSPRFYASVLRSRAIMDSVLLARYKDPRGGGDRPDSATLLEILSRELLTWISGDDLADSLHEGREELGDLVSVGVDNQTKIVVLSVDSRSPTLAADVANRFIHYLHEFNAKTRQSQAGERRSFAEQQVAEAERQLNAAEEAMKRFYERNRSFQQSPQLVFEEGRLSRQVDIRQEMYLTLKREHETARIDEVNDVPVITVIDSASPPQERSKPKRVLLIVLAFVLGGMAGGLGAFGLDSLDRVRREREGDYRELQGLVSQVGDDVRGALRRGRDQH